MLKQLPSSQAIPLWDKFIQEHPQTLPFSFHPSLYFFYTNHFRWKAYYFLIYRNEQLFALLPIINTTKKWVSLPHFSYGGTITNDSLAAAMDDSVIHTIIDQTLKENLSPGFISVYLDALKPQSEEKTNVYIRSLNRYSEHDHTMKTSSFIELPEKPEMLFDQLSSNLRRKIRKAQTNDITVHHVGKALLEDFYRVYSHNVHRLGSPAYGKSFFASLHDALEPEEAVFFVAKKKGRPVGSAFLLSYQGFFENAWFATSRDARKDYVSDLLHWEMISHAISSSRNQSNFKKGMYSFGRSTTDGSVHLYKRHWPVIDVPIYEYHSLPSSSVKNQIWLSSIWKNLPSPLVRFLGPKLIKHIY